MSTEFHQKRQHDYEEPIMKSRRDFVKLLGGGAIASLFAGRVLAKASISAQPTSSQTSILLSDYRVGHGMKILIIGRDRQVGDIIRVLDEYYTVVAEHPHWYRVVSRGQASNNRMGQWLWLSHSLKSDPRGTPVVYVGRLYDRMSNQS